MAYSMPGDASDSCSCIVAHKLGAPFMTVYAIPFITGPLSVPQVR
jgi:hypothetical protein